MDYNTSEQPPEISVILPCLNEEKAIGLCLDQVSVVIKKHSLNAEILVVDNDSSDQSAQIVITKSKQIRNLKLINEKRRGYGSAYMAGLQAATGKYVFMADADCTYSFDDIPRFVSELKKGADLVIGNRFTSDPKFGPMKSSSMPWLHRYLGNPVLSFVVRKFFHVNIRDIHCGVRALKKSSYDKVILYTIGMEFASEMVIKMAKQRMKLVELPVSYQPRIGISKLQSFTDGWRHLRFILLYSPLYLFVIPGIAISGLGLVLMIILYVNKLKILGVQLLVHPMFLFSLMIMVGYQIILFGGFSKIYAITHLGETDHKFEKMFRYITIEKAGLLGGLVTVVGAVIYVYIISKWISSGLGSLDEIKNSVVALTFTVLGIQTFFSAFMLSTLGIRER